MSNSLNPNQNQHSVGSALETKCLQKLSADDNRSSRLFPAILEKAPGENWEKMIDLGEINDKEHNKGSKIKLF